MTIILLLLLGISFFCALTLVGACIISARSRNVSEEIMPVEEYEPQHTMAPSAASLQTTTRAAS